MKQSNVNRDDRIDLNGIPWRLVLPQLGVAEEYLKGVHGPCPACGGKDRFRFANHHGNRSGPEIGMWHCNQCGSGNGFELVRQTTGLSDAEIFQRLKEIIGRCDKRPMGITLEAAAGMIRKNPEEDGRKTAGKLSALWQEAKKLTGNDPVSRYLRERVPDCDLDRIGCDVRHHPALPYYCDSQSGESGQRRLLGVYPGMILRIRALCGRPISIHRTFLTEKGEKASVPNVKKLMTGTRTLNGAAIRVFDTDSRILGVCEGFETGLAIARARKYGISVWSLINAGNLAKADIPGDRFDKVLVFADDDPIDKNRGYRPGEHAAEVLKERLKTEGFETEVIMPKHQGQDFADVWLEWCRMRGTGANPGNS